VDGGSTYFLEILSKRYYFWWIIKAHYFVCGALVRVQQISLIKQNNEIGGCTFVTFERKIDDENCNFKERR